MDSLGVFQGISVEKWQTSVRKILATKKDVLTIRRVLPSAPTAAKLKMTIVVDAIRVYNGERLTVDRPEHAPNRAASVALFRHDAHAASRII